MGGLNNKENNSGSFFCIWTYIGEKKCLEMNKDEVLEKEEESKLNSHFPDMKI